MRIASPFMGNEQTKQATLSALGQWAVQHKNAAEERSRLIAEAWTAGTRSVTLLAETAGVSRGTVYSDLRASGINPSNKDQDPALTRLMRAVARLAMQFNSGNPFTAETLVSYGPPVTAAAALLVAFEDAELVRAVRAILAAAPHGDRDTALLAEYVTELRDALDQYTQRGADTERRPRIRVIS